MSYLELYRGQIPYFLKKNRKRQSLYLCSSYRNLEDYFPVLQDLLPQEAYAMKDLGEQENKSQKYEVKQFMKTQKQGILLLTLDMFLKDYSPIGKQQSFVWKQEYSISQLIETLEEASFQKNYLIEKKGEYSLRGDILDIYPSSSSFPIRLEFFGEEIERISVFDPISQKSIENLESFDMYIDNNNSIQSFFEFLELSFSELDIYFENTELLHYKLEEKLLLEEEEEAREKYRQRFQDLLQYGQEIRMVQFSQEMLESLKKAEYLENIEKEVWILTEDIEKYEKQYSGKNFFYKKYPLFEGYETSSKLVLTDRELRGIRIRREERKRKRLLFTSPEQIHEGEYIIHENYGVGIYLGIELLDGKDYFKIKYADEDKLFVPLEGIHKIEKYVNVPGTVPEVYHLGRRGFQRKKKKLQEDILEFAKEIVEIQAKRHKLSGFIYSKDTVWQEEFEEEFPFTETEAQKKAIHDVKLDMEEGRIMDRLICGDVGYGKTEIAIRAAFKTIMDQKQVVLLAPTTVLAEQHFLRFQERFSPYPLEIASLSRMKTKKEQEKVVLGLEKGSVDLVIGTSRLLSEDIHFKNLGLLIIDEEQKFGVKAKEKFKKMRGDVNILTMTATPIPRTLNLSLLGIRDISIIDTPPEGRKPVQTFFIPKEKSLIRKAILTELSREGQVFYIFNSVSRIQDKVKELQSFLPPYIRVDYIHGKMSAREMKQKIQDFESMQIDVLVSTTILENGIDIENANTMIIEGMERLGLSQIYQLRGRVGRGNRQSYCYCIVSEYKSKKASKREKSLIELGEGSGFDLSMEDLKIRGAGEILGEKQHGAIETLGYHFYLKMLEMEIEKLKGNLPELEEEKGKIEIKMNFPKYIPDSYIQKEEKIGIYKRALELNSLEEISALEQELRDRFGKYPVEVKGFFQFLQIQYFCKKFYIQEIVEENQKYWIRFEEEKVNVEKIVDLFTSGKIDYSQKTKQIAWSGNIFQFFKLYEKK